MRVASVLGWIACPPGLVFGTGLASLWVGEWHWVNAVAYGSPWLAFSLVAGAFAGSQARRLSANSEPAPEVEALMAEFAKVAGAEAMSARWSSTSFDTAEHWNGQTFFSRDEWTGLTDSERRFCAALAVARRVGADSKRRHIPWLGLHTVGATAACLSLWAIFPVHLATIGGMAWLGIRKRDVFPSDALAVRWTDDLAAAEGYIQKTIGGRFGAEAAERRIEYLRAAYRAS